MKSKPWTALIILWGVSILLLGTGRINPPYLVEKAMGVFNFEFSSKEAYVQAVHRVAWMRGMYFAALAGLTLHVFGKQQTSS